MESRHRCMWGGCGRFERCVHQRVLICSSRVHLVDRLENLCRSTCCHLVTSEFTPRTNCGGVITRSFSCSCSIKHTCTSSQRVSGIPLQSEIHHIAFVWGQKSRRYCATCIPRFRTTSERHFHVCRSSNRIPPFHKLGRNPYPAFIPYGNVPEGLRQP